MHYQCQAQQSGAITVWWKDWAVHFTLGQVVQSGRFRQQSHWGLYSVCPRLEALPQMSQNSLAHECSVQSNHILPTSKIYYIYKDFIMTVITVVSMSFYYECIQYSNNGIWYSVKLLSEKKYNTCWIQFSTIQRTILNQALVEYISWNHSCMCLVICINSIRLLMYITHKVYIILWNKHDIKLHNISQTPDSVLHTFSMSSFLTTNKYTWWQNNFYQGFSLATSGFPALFCSAYSALSSLWYSRLAPRQQVEV